MEITWECIKEKEDFYISYLLYKEGKTIELISLIRNISKEEAGIHIIKAKDIIRNNSKEKENKKNLDYILSLDKEKKIDFINSIEVDNQIEIKRELYRRMTQEKNIEDLIAMIWISGEFKDEKFLKIIHQYSFHLNGNIRRIAYSAMKKIGSTESLDYLHRGIIDKKPQVRQYAAKTLEIIGNEESLKKLKNLMDKKDEKDYVKRSFSRAIEEIEKRTK